MVHDGETGNPVIQREFSDLRTALLKIRAAFNHPNDKVLNIVAGFLVQDAAFHAPTTTQPDKETLKALGLEGAVATGTVVIPPPRFESFGEVKVTPESLLVPAEPMLCGCGGISYDGTPNCSPKDRCAKRLYAAKTGYRLLQPGESLQAGDEAWTHTDPDCKTVGWLKLDKVYPEQKIDGGHVPVRRKVEA
jgi:hypothetical protein